MNEPETPEEKPRVVLRKETPETRERRAEEFVPQYVHLPERPRSAGTRNLQLGVLCIGFALVLLVIANVLSGSRTLLPLASCLLAFTLLWVLARMHLFHQRNGVFLAVGLVFLLGGALAFFERGYSAASRFAHMPTMADLPATLAPAATPAPEIAVEPRSLTQVFGKVDAVTTGRRVEVLKDSRVSVKGEPYLIKQGEMLALDEMKGDRAIVSVGDMRISLASSDVQIVSGANDEKPAPATEAPTTPAEITKRAQLEAVRRYPALGKKDSPENEIYIETFRELRNTGSDLLKDPEWPIHLADSIARKEGWERQGE